MEWEFAARGGIPAQNAGSFDDSYAGTNVAGTEAGQLGDYAWYKDNSDIGHGKQSQPVGTKLPNELGLYDMSGNVINLVWDMRDDYPTGVHNNPTGPTTSNTRVARGGNWLSRANNCNISGRGMGDAMTRSHSAGFRVSRRTP